MEFSDTVKSLLQNVGWSNNRKVNKINYPIDNYPEFVKAFLNNLGMLKIKDKEYANKYQTYVPSFLNLDPMIGKGEYDSDGYFTYYKSIIQKELYCLGYYSPDNYYICCDNDGRVYKIGEYCFCIGNNLYEGIENLLLMNTLQSFQLDEDTGKWWNMDAEYVEPPPLE